jgi:hypothetical protein
VFKCYCNMLICVLVILLVFRRMRSSSIASWTSIHKDYDIARFRLKVSVEYVGSVESYIFNKVR